MYLHAHDPLRPLTLEDCVRRVEVPFDIAPQDYFNGHSVEQGDEAWVVRRRYLLNIDPWNKYTAFSVWYRPAELEDL